MANISWLYKNKANYPSTIVDSIGTSNTTDYGSAFASDNNLQSEWRSNHTSGIGTFLFDFGSSIYVDSLIAVHNLNNTGTMYIKAGNTNPPTTVNYGMPLLSTTGTSMNYLASPVNYRYWQFIMDGTKLNDVIKLKEVFIGKRDELPINPEWPFKIETNTSTIVTQSKSGHKYVYRKYDKTKWDFSYPSINQAEFGTLNNMRSFCKGAYLPFFICIDREDNKFDTKFVRLIKGSWKHSEVAYNIHDVSFSVEEEL